MTVYSKHIKDSSVIKALAWDSEDQTLVINFLTNSVWAYFNVPKNVFKNLLKADSLGSFFNKNIRNTYSSLRIDNISHNQENIVNG